MEYSMSTLKTNTIQAATGTAVNVASGHVLNAAGHVIQTKSMTLTSSTTASSNSYTDSGLTLNITPSATSSKILITGFICLGVDYFKNYIRVVRDSTDLAVGDEADTRERAFASALPADTGWDSYGVVAVPINLLDSPNTTSLVNYKVQFKCYRGTGGTAAVNRSYSDRNNSGYDERTVSVLTLQEIAA
jgi:hypothetical protein